MKKKNIKDEFPVILESKLGIITDACKAVGINRSTYYAWRTDDPAFALACDEVQDTAIDFVEGKLFDNIREGKETSIIFYLKTKAKKRGYVERQELEQKVEVKSQALGPEDRAILDHYIANHRKN